VLCTLLPNDRKLTEAQVNDHLVQAGDDVAGLRRLLVGLRFMRRGGSAEYEVIHA
jgi:hypothetical protein